MDPMIQSKLLRLLQEKTYRRVGGGYDRKADIRIMVTSSVMLENAVENGRFREDLFHRLNRVVLNIPALRDRPHDIIPMAQQFAERSYTEIGKKFHGFTGESQAALQGYQWPGNVLELVHVMERAALVSPTNEKVTNICGFMGVSPASQVTVDSGLHADHSTASTSSNKSAQVLQLQSPVESYTKLKRRWSFSFEREYLVAILNRHEGNVSAAAREANLDRSNFLRLLRRHRMTAQEFRRIDEFQTEMDSDKKAA